VHAAVLERADHLEPGAIADVREALPGVAAERALQDAPVRRAVEQRAPLLELADAVRRLLRVDLRHAPVIQERAALHRVLEMRLPAVLRIHVRERRRDPALGHHGVRLAEQRLAHEADRDACGRSLDCRAQSRAARADHEHRVLVHFVAIAHSSLRSWNTPIEHMRM